MITGHNNTLRLLIEAGADLSLKDIFGRTPLDYARQSKRMRSNSSHRYCNTECIDADILETMDRILNLHQGITLKIQ